MEFVKNFKLNLVSDNRYGIVNAINSSVDIKENLFN
jgi:hypothetical protein